MWQSRPIFISSTFVDMQAERDYLRNHVFPDLELRLKARRCHLEWVDLRVGIPTAETENRVLEICLQEVSRCRPFLIVLLGDRYGWVPPGELADVIAREVNLSAPPDTSVTELEILLGALAQQDHEDRTLFYFRESLPYSQMLPELAKEYCDALDPDPAAQSRAQRLQALKGEIRAKIAADRIHSYRATWESNPDRPEAGKIVGFQGWNVAEDLWKRLDPLAPQSDTASEDGWTDEQFALEAFIEERSRGFVGREELFATLAEPLSGNASSEGNAITCLVGEPGSGKSAIFAILHRTFAQNADVTLLAHAAGVDQGSVQGMLLRWCDQLEAALGKTHQAAQLISSRAIERAFSELLEERANQQRVIILVDAVDQFARTPQSIYSSWLPRRLHRNVRVVVTANEGEVTKEFLRRDHARLATVPPLEAHDAAAIVTEISARYHRSPEPLVVQAIVDMPGSPWRNPLWLTLVVERLNLIGADELSRAKTYQGSPPQQIRSLLLELVVAQPAEVRGVYAATFEKASQVFGATWTDAFLGLLAIGRMGWRESDLVALLPELTGEDWDALKFASMRRFFRGQIAQNKVTSAWDVSHGQMRISAAGQVTPAATQRLHECVARHLLSLDPTDPVRVGELMHHLLGAREFATAARFYGVPYTADDEVQGATRDLAQRLASIDEHERKSCLSDIEEMYSSIREEGETAFWLASRLSLNLGAAIQHLAAPDTRVALHRMSVDTYEELERLNPTNALAPASQAQGLLLGNHALACSNFAQALRAAGYIEEATTQALRSSELSQRAGKLDPDLESAAFSNEMVNLSEQGAALAQQGRHEEAIAIYTEALERIGPFNFNPLLSQKDVGVIQERLGVSLIKLGRFDEALSTLLDAEMMLESNFVDTSAVCFWAATAFWCLDRSAEAANYLVKAAKTAEELVAKDPAHRNNRFILQTIAAGVNNFLDKESELAQSLHVQGGEEVDKGALPEAMETFKRGLATIERVVEVREKLGIGAENQRMACAVFHLDIGKTVVAMKNGDASDHFTMSTRIAQEVFSKDPSNKKAQDIVAVAGAYRLSAVADEAFRKANAGTEAVSGQVSSAAPPNDETSARTDEWTGSSEMPSRRPLQLFPALGLIAALLLAAVAAFAVFG